VIDCLPDVIGPEAELAGRTAIVGFTGMSKYMPKPSLPLWATWLEHQV